MDPFREGIESYSRRQFLGSAGLGLGAAAMGSMLSPGMVSGQGPVPAHLTHIAPKAKRAIYLFMAGAPCQLDLFDYKPKMKALYGKGLPDWVTRGQRKTGMTSNQASFPIAPSQYEFKQHGKSGAWMSELLPNIANMVDDIAIIKSMHTEAINHDPAITFICTGKELPGQASLGSWLSYGLGSMNKDLPDFVVMTAKWSAKRSAQALYNRLWGSGFLPSKHQGVALRSGDDPVLFLSNPDGVDRRTRRRMLDVVSEMNQMQFDAVGDREIQTRISQYEMAFRMQRSVPELTDLSGEPDHIYDLYGADAKIPGTFAAQCLLARRMIERDVRFVQIFHRGWDQHGNVAGDLPLQCKDVDRASYALVQDLKQRGLLDDTLVIWGGEFGRTMYSQGELSRSNYGRDHHPKCFSIWMAGGGVQGGVVHGETCDYGYNIVDKDGNYTTAFEDDAVHVRDLNATILHQMGIHHEKLIYPYQGLDQRLTGVEEAHVIRKVLS